MSKYRRVGKKVKQVLKKEKEKAIKRHELHAASVKVPTQEQKCLASSRKRKGESKSF